jgi:four helix bundle protein
MDNQSNEKKYDLAERTAKFGEAIIVFCKKIKRSPVNDPLITQLVKAGTSIGANYCEADNAESKRDFRHKIGICKKESGEAKHFIRMIAVAVTELKEDAKPLWIEAKELNLIFNSIYIKVKDQD